MNRAYDAVRYSKSFSTVSMASVIDMLPASVARAFRASLRCDDRLRGAIELLFCGVTVTARFHHRTQIRPIRRDARRLTMRALPFADRDVERDRTAEVIECVDACEYAFPHGGEERRECARDLIRIALEITMLPEIVSHGDDRAVDLHQGRRRGAVLLQGGSHHGQSATAWASACDAVAPVFPPSATASAASSIRNMLVRSAGRSRASIADSVACAEAARVVAADAGAAANASADDMRAATAADFV